MTEKEKALYISSNLFPVNSGATIYTYGNILRFSRQFNLDLITFVQSSNVTAEPYFNELKEKVNKFTEIRFDTSYLEMVLNALRYKVLFQKYSRPMVATVRNLLKEKSYRYIFLDHILVFHLIQLVRNYQNSAKIILIEHNIEYQNFNEQIRYSPGILQKWKNYLLSLGMRRFELQSLLHSDYTLFISEQDRSSAQKALEQELKSAVLPPYFPYKQVKTTGDLEQKTYRLLILGSMWWYPNVQGTQWFIEEVFQPLKERDKRYTLYIVGKDPVQELLKYASDSIVLTGIVPSVDEYIKTCDFLIVPNFSGGGVKIKIYEGIMKGIPVLARPESLTGYSKQIFPEEYIPRDADSFVRIIT
jgi:glycosyltransferase involved in cell wall biosynthesis